MSRLGPTGLTQLLTDIKTWITTKLGNYVTTDTTQTVTGKKYFTNSTTQVNSVNTFTGSTLFIDTSASAPRGSFPESAYRVGRIYIGDGTSYNGSWFIIDPTIDTNRAYYRMVTTNPDNTDSARFSICWDSRYEGVRRRRNISMGDLLPSGASTYNLGESGNAWQDAYINKIHGISDYTNLKTNTFNVNTTLTHGGSGRRVILAMGAITLTVPAPEEGSWFLIKAVNGLVTLNLASNVTVTGITAGAFSGPIHLQPNESILLCYYSSTIYNATISTIRRSGVVGRTGNVPSENPKHWFKIAENYVTATYRDPFICLRVFEGTTGNTIGTLCAHCRIDNTVGVVATYNCYLQWQDAGSGIDLSKYALTTNETSGTGVTIALWCTLTGGYSSLKFEVVSECGQSDQLGNPEWVLTRRRQADGDLAELSDTDFTKIVYSTLTTLKNDTTGKASNVTGTVAIANGGTGATTRLNAVKNLTNEAVGTPTHFLAITTNWGKAGYTTVAQAKTVLGITGDMGSHSDSEYVHKTGDESITGTKTFGNGTLIVDNGTGNNVHGEIKLNGTRPVYINADNSEDGLFANTACGMSILLNDASKSIHIGGITTGANGRKIIKTSEKVPYLTLGTQEVGTQILVPENDTADSAFSITSTLKYASGAAAKSFTVKFKQGDDGSSGVFPVANNKTDLGLSGNRWKNVYATNYYYGADAVEFSTKFVTTDTNQVISGGKTFTSSPLIYNSDATGSIPQITFKNSKTTKGSTTETGAQLIYFTDKNDAPLSMIESRVVSNGCTTLSTVAYNFNDSQNVSSSVQLIKNPTTAYYAPGADNDISLGRASARWLGVYATNYYYGSGNVEFSTKFVTTDTAQTITGVKTFNSDTLVANQGNAYRIANSAGTGYGVFQRTDGTYWYMLVTANNDPLGTWTSARPITIRLSDGYCTINGKANEANKVQATIAAGTTAALVQASVASNDVFRIAAGGAANAGWAEIATGDDANEPIYVRQYKGAFATLQRTATLLDGSGNTSFPGTVTATGFSGPLTGDVTGTATKATGNANGNEITDTVIKGLSISGKTITYTKIDGNTGTLTTQDTVYTHPTTSGNKHIPSGGSSGQFLGWDSDGTAKWVNNPNTNTDTLMTQNVSTTDSTYPILLCATANATSNQGAKTGIFGSGVKVNPKTSVVSAKGFSGIPTGNTYVTAVKDGGALVNSQATSWGAIWRAPTKDYQVAGATWSNTNNNVYICYSVTNANAEAGTNTMAKSLIWAADTGTLTTTTFSGALSGNASTATEFSANKDVTLTGDVTGTASSKAGWSVATTLANSGVTAGTYGPSADVTGNNNATISVPEITVDAKGRVTAVTNRTYTSVNTDSDKKVYQYYKSDDNVYRLLFSNNAGNTATSNVGAVYSGLNNSFYVNPSTGALYAAKLYSNGVEVLTAHQSLSNYVTLNTAQEITNTKTFKDANTVVKRTDIEAGNTLPSADKLARNIFQDKNGKELGSIFYYKNTSGNTGLCLRAGDWFSESEGVYSLNASGTNRRAELVLYTNSSGDCCIQPNGYFSSTLKALSTSVWLGESTKPFGRVYANAFEFCNAGLLPDTDVQTTEEHSIGFFGQNNTPLSYITFQKRPNLKDRIAIRINTTSSAYKSYCFDASCLYPESNNSVDIGSTTNIFKNIYCNNYYKGTTAFGDIVTHNASEFLTSHQSLANYVTLNSNQTITAIKTITGGNQGKMIFKNPNFTLGTTPESTTTVTRIYFGGGASYDGSTGAISNDIASNGNSQLEICALNNNSSSSYRASLILRYEQDQTRPRFIKSWGDFCPYSDDTYYLGRSDSVWKECYCNAYYLGTTAFGDIVTHNASEFLTSHQSLSSCVKNAVTNNQTIKSTGITRGTAPSSAQTFGIGFSDNNNKSIGNVYGQYATDKSTYVGLYAYKGTTTSNGDNASVRVGYDASGNAYTYAPTPATADNSTQIATTAFVKAQGYLTSHQSLANYVTLNTDQTISAIKSHSKHISILGDYVGNEASTNSRSCLYLKANRDTDGKSGLYVTKFRQNVAQGSMGSSDVVFLSHDILENETRTNAGFVESYSNWTNNVPGGMSVYSTIATRNLGTSAKPWTNAYITNLTLNGHLFNPASTTGNIGDIVFACAYFSAINGTQDLGLIVSGNALYLAGFTGNQLVFSASTSNLSGTWASLGKGKPATTTENSGAMYTSLWKRIS